VINEECSAVNRRLVVLHDGRGLVIYSIVSGWVKLKREASELARTERARVCLGHSSRMCETVSSMRGCAGGEGGKGRDWG
jgi:hypothetical protein